MSPELTPAVIGAGAVILAALISFIVAVTSAVIAKEQKISEFRQVWINELRTDIASMINLANDCTFNLICIRSEKPNTEKRKDLHLTYNSTMSALEFKRTLIKLKLNPDKDKAFIYEIDLVIDKINNASDKCISNNKFDELIESANATFYSFEEKSHIILKSEWERVKKGELLYRSFTVSGEIFIGGLLAAFLVLVLSSNFPQYCPIVG